jgi:putative nucleotidyltransferase with HDIG domain
LRKSTQIVVATILLLAAAALAFLYAVQPNADPRELAAVGAFAVFSVFGALMPYALSERVSGTATFITFLASVVLVPTWLTVLGAISVLILESLVHRRALIKGLFNVSQHGLALACAVAAYSFFDARGAISGNEVNAFGLVAAYLCFFAVNSLAVSAVLSSESEGSFAEIWQESVKGVLFDIIALPFVYVFAKLYLSFGVLATSAAAALVLIVRQLNSSVVQLHTSNKELLELTVTTLEARDPYTSGHSRRVAQYSRMMGQVLGLTEKQLDRLAVAALLHDVGKIHEAFAPILSKPGKLTAEERAIMESHPIKGAELVRISSHLRDTVEPIRHHHEAWDGSGYPDALVGERIPLFARIIAVADTIDAMASDRPYRRGLSADRIREELIRMRGIQFDPEMLSKLTQAGTIAAVLRLACEGHEYDAAGRTIPMVAEA